MMTKLLKLSPELSPPIDALMQPIALLGNRGAGKTYAGMKLFELAHDAGVQCIAVDGIGKWWGLRLAADGKTSGLKDVYIFGGKRADFPITPDRGAFVARVLVERRVHAVLDVSQLRKGDRRKFLTDFAEEFHLLKKQDDQPTPSVMFLEEAHQVLPQKPFGDEARMLGAFEDLIREGRNAGIGMVVMDQRPATVNKNALALVEILIALRTTYEIDRKVYVGWVVQKVAKDGLSQVDLEQRLPFLKAGEGFLYAPMFDLFEHIHIYPKRTFDSSATAKIGVKSATLGTLMPVDVERVKDAMAVVTAEVAAKDPTALRKKVAELERLLAAKQQPAPIAQATIEVGVPIKKDLEALERAIGKLEELRDRTAQQQQVVVASIDNAKTILRFVTPKIRVHPAFTAVGRGSLPEPQRFPANPNVPNAYGVTRNQARAAQGSTIGKGERTVLIAVAQHSDGVTREQLSVLTGYKRSSRDTYLQRLATNDMVSQQGDRLFATECGVEALGEGFEPLPSGAALREHWLRRLPEGERRVFEVVIGWYPHSVPRDAIDESTGYKRSSRDTYLQRLSARRLVIATAEGICASETLFASEAA
jgi:hypothetical protein